MASTRTLLSSTSRIETIVRASGRNALSIIRFLDVLARSVCLGKRANCLPEALHTGLNFVLLITEKLKKNVYDFK